MTMAAEIKNRMGPPQTAPEPGANKKVPLGPGSSVKQGGGGCC